MNEVLITEDELLNNVKKAVKTDMKIDWIVSLRALATLAVVLLHVISGGGRRLIIQGNY